MPEKVKGALKCLTEDQEQIKFCVWLDKNKILYFAIANGGSRHVLEAMKLKRTGVKAGVPDLCIPVPAGGYHGLYIEMKRIKGGIVSDSQKDWLDKLRNNGYWADVARGFEEAKVIVQLYFKGYSDVLVA